MKRWLAIGILILLTLWALLFWRSSSDRAMSPNPVASSSTSSAGAPPPAVPRGAEPAQPAARAPQPQPAPQRAQRPDAAAEQPEPPKVPPEQVPPVAAGYLAALKRAYESESRDAQASAAEARLRALFGTEHVPRDMLRSATCHARVCRMQVIWSPSRGLAYHALLITAGQQINEAMAVEPHGVPDRAGNLEVDVYVLREGIHIGEL